MIPIRDSTPSYTFPIVVVSLILTNVLVFLYEMSLEQQIVPFLHAYGLVAREFMLAASATASPSTSARHSVNS